MEGIDPMFWRLVFRALTMRLRRVAVVFTALAVGASIVTAMAAIYFDINAKMSRELRAYGANFFVGPAHGGLIGEETVRLVSDKAPQGLIVAGSPYLMGVARTELARVALLGVDFEQLRTLTPYWQVEGSWVGVNFDDQNAMIGRKAAQRLDVKVGDRLTLLESPRTKSLKIKGIIEAGDATDNVLVVNLALAQDWLRLPGKISHLLLRVNNEGDQVDALAAAVRQGHPELDVRPIRKVSASEGAVLDKIKGLMGLVSLIILTLSTLCVNTTLLAMVGERAREFALQKALGASSGSLFRQIAAETGIIVLAAIAAGWAAGYLLAQVLGQVAFSSAINFRAPVLPLTAILSLTVALLASIVPVHAAMGIEPAKVLKGE